MKYKIKIIGSVVIEPIYPVYCGGYTTKQGNAGQYPQAYAKTLRNKLSVEWARQGATVELICCENTTHFGLFDNVA